jgi:hypothetical protein
VLLCLLTSAILKMLAPFSAALVTKPDAARPLGRALARFAAPLAAKEGIEQEASG